MLGGLFMPWTLGSMAARQPMDSNSNPPGYEQPMEGQPDNLQTRAPIHLAMSHLSPFILNIAAKNLLW